MIHQFLCGHWWLYMYILYCNHCDSTKVTSITFFFFCCFFLSKESAFDNRVYFVYRSKLAFTAVWWNPRCDDKIEPPHDKTNKMACAPIEDSDQPGHPPSLIRVFDVRMKKAWVLSYPLSAWRRLWSDWADAQADLSLRWAYSHFVGFVVRRLKFFLNAFYAVVL